VRDRHPGTPALAPTPCPTHPSITERSSHARLSRRTLRRPRPSRCGGHSDHPPLRPARRDGHQLAANGTAAAEDAARRAAASSQDTEWGDIARTAAIQALAAATVGASLLDVAVRSLQQGDAEHARFREKTRAEIAKAA
jgi:hypothetical protein